MLMLSGCEHNSEQVAAEVLGYTQVSWENLSGDEPQPSSHKKSWSELRHSERVAAVLLGYTGKVWDNESGSEPQPASAKKQWSQLSPCADEGRYADGVRTCRAMFVHIAISSLVWWMLLCERVSVCTHIRRVHAFGVLADCCIISFVVWVGFTAMHALQSATASRRRHKCWDTPKCCGTMHPAKNDSLRRPISIGPT